MNIKRTFTDWVMLGFVAHQGCFRPGDGWEHAWIQWTLARQDGDDLDTSYVMHETLHAHGRGTTGFSAPWARAGATKDINRAR
jgi:hypothetical protein